MTDKVIQLVDAASGYNKRQKRIRLEITISQSLWDKVDWGMIPYFNKLRVEYLLVSQIRSLFIVAFCDVLARGACRLDDCQTEALAKVKESLILEKKRILKSLSRQWNVHPNQVSGVTNPAYSFVSQFLDAPDFMINELDKKTVTRLSFVAQAITSDVESYIRIAEFYELFGEVHYLSKQRVHASNFKQRANGQLKRIDVMRDLHQQYGEREAKIAIDVYEKLLGMDETSYLVRDSMAFITKRVGVNTRRFDFHEENFPHEELARSLSSDVLLGQLHETEFGTLVFVKDSVLHEFEEASIDVKSLAQLYLLVMHDLTVADHVYIESPSMGLNDDQRLKLLSWLKKLENHGLIVKAVD